MQQGAKVETIMDFVRSDPDILECSGVTGEYDYLLKICAKDIESLEEKILCIKNNKGVMKKRFDLDSHLCLNGSLRLLLERSFIRCCKLYYTR